MYIRGHKISQTSAMHYTKLVCRSFLFLLVLGMYVLGRIAHVDTLQLVYDFVPWVFFTLFTIFVVEMSFRFFPSSMESKGCQKQFEENYIPTGTQDAPKIDNAARTIMVALSWILLNGIVAALYYMGIIDQMILILICLLYSVCDMICILYFCPFQTWMMKNKCCGTCRIYNWDYVMMFTPCLFIKHPLAKIIFIIAALLCLEWEVIYYYHPERFAENTNAFLSCENCTEKLCSHKIQLQKYLVLFRKTLLDEKEKLEHK